MEQINLATIAIACAASAGGIGGIIIASVKFCSEFIANRLSAKYEMKLQEELERSKTLNDRKNYISKVRFDKEFEIYQSLSEKQITLVYDIGESVMVARGMYKEDATEARKFIDRFTEDINGADISLKKYGCFISKEIFEQYRNLDEMGKDIYKLSLFLFEHSNDAAIFNCKGKRYDADSAKQEIERLQKIVSDLSDKIIEQIRTYLHSLDVL